MVIKLCAKIARGPCKKLTHLTILRYNCHRKSDEVYNAACLHLISVVGFLLSTTTRSSSATTFRLGICWCSEMLPKEFPLSAFIDMNNTIPGATDSATYSCMHIEPLALLLLRLKRRNLTSASCPPWIFPGTFSYFKRWDLFRSLDMQILSLMIPYAFGSFLPWDGYQPC